MKRSRGAYRAKKAESNVIRSLTPGARPYRARMTSFFTHECGLAQCGQLNLPDLFEVPAQSGSSIVSPVATNLAVAGQRTSRRRSVLGALRGGSGIPK